MPSPSSRLALLTVLTGLLLPAVPASAAPPDLPVWGSVPSPNRGTQADELLAVDVVTPTEVWAVGEYNNRSFDSTTRRTLAQRWDGTGWTLVPTPNPSFAGIDAASLEGVSGLRADDVWAVGHGNDFGSLRSRTLVEHWDGAAWRIVPSPNPAGQNLPNELYDVVAVGPDEVWAVGLTGSPARALILRFDGTAWRVVPNACGGGLRGITAVPGTPTLWAVGENTTCRFDGATWTRVDPPEFPDLEDVSATPTGEVWAVGFEVFCDPFTCYSSSVIQRLQGSQWVNVPHPLATSLNGVYAAAADDVWAVGTNSVGTVIRHWNGVRWSVVPSPDPESGGALAAVDGLGRADLWAAGTFFDDEFDQRTLVLQAPSTTQGQVVGATRVSGAVVSWFGPATGSVTADVFGRYAAPGLPAGQYTLTASDPFGSCQPVAVTVTVGVNQTLVQNLRPDC